MLTDDSHAGEEKKLFFEVFERALRLYNHVRLSKEQTARPNRRQTAQQLIADELINGLHEVLNDIAEIYRKSFRTGPEQYIRVLDMLADIHIKALIAIPKPCEPIELVSYLRQVIDTFGNANGQLKKVPLVFATEVLGDQAHEKFEINNEMADVELLRLLERRDVNGFKQQSKLLIDQEKQRESIGYVSLPRIDLNNPLRWPSLIHEISHFFEETKKDLINQKFKEAEGGVLHNIAIHALSAYLKEVGRDDLNVEEELNSWLLECYCDVYAVRASGVPALFSQMHAFLFGKPCYLTEEKPSKNGGYPPGWFRLRLMRSLITHRHRSNNSSDQKIKQIINDEWILLFQLFKPSRGADVSQNANLRILFEVFDNFLASLFPQNNWFEQSIVSPEILKDLIADLSSGLPIPTHKKIVNGVQSRASHAEILTAGWAYRNEKLKKELLDAVINSESIDKLAALIDRADAALQMSLQVSEWFSILNFENDYDASKDVKKVYTRRKVLREPSGLLPDHEIKKLIEKHSLRVIPLIGGINSIVGTVIDIRLGHNFEIFFTNISGSVDPLDPFKRDAADSMEVDYDSLDGLEIAPGQFVLGHTLEYIRLPDDIAAEINARSSFARLGIEVHMTAPFVEAGFNGCLTLEIANSGHSSVKLYPGMRIAQLRFHRCTSFPESSYANRPSVKYSGHLRHNKAAQFGDWEINSFRAEKIKRDK